MKKRLIAILLILSMVLTVFPMAAFAEEPACKHEHTAPYSEVFGNTRGEFFLMLWKMYGCPEPRIEDKFEDVSEADVFYKAVLWATQNNISNGLTDTQFRPEQATTRAQAVTFLWRAAGCPEPENPYTTFRDLKSGAFYEKAVAWAAEQDWLELRTDGVDFRPDYSVGEFVLEGTVCEDCGAILETTKLTFSASATAKGTFGNDLQWELGESVLTVTGSGQMPELDENENTPWHKYADQIRELEISEGVLNICNRAFAHCDNLRKVKIADSVEYIGDLAFYDCDTLTVVTIPGSVQYIGDQAFDMTYLYSVTISEGVKSIGDNAFGGSIYLNEVSIPSSVVHVGANAFGYDGPCGKWENEIRYLDGWAINSISQYAEVQIKSGTRGIADEVFCENMNITSIALPDSLQCIGFNAFASTGLKSVTLPKNLQCIYDGAFSGCIALKNVKIPESVEYLGDGAFYGCPNLTSVSIPNSLTELGMWTFGYDENLKSVEIPESVEFVGEYAFYGCESLKSVTIANKECVIEEGDEEPEYMLGIPGQTTIYGYADSTAQAYAGKYGYRFVELSEKVPFIDVPAKAFYVDPVAWAVENDITKGVDDTHFGSDKACTRGQVVTFLWRAAGCPEPKSTETGFKDMKPGAFYEKAVAWAVEEGITKGLSDTAFGPDATCTRGQIVTFLWRFKGEPAPKSTQTPFTDVNPNGFYLKAVAWAVEEGITKGLTETTFGPEETCSRGQVVTFLYRATQE